MAAGREDHAKVIQALQQSACTTTRPPRRHRRRTITKEEIQQLIAHARARKDYLTAFALALGSRYGVRAAELTTLKIQGKLLFVKTAKRTRARGSNRWFAIRDSEMHIYIKYIPQLAQISAAALRDRLYRLSKEVFPRRQGITYHRIRHQVSSNFKASGVDIALIAKILGQRSTRSVFTYGDPRRGKTGQTPPPVRAEFEPTPTSRQPPSKNRMPKPAQ
jgi:hypothetical protein